MQAILEADTQAGPGYGILHIKNVPDQGEPALIISRLEDGLTFAPGGWKKGKNSFTPDRWNWFADCYNIWLGPEIVDDLASDEHYELTLPGVGSCKLIISEICDTTVINPNNLNASASAYASIPATAVCPPSPVYEGVESFPDIVSDTNEFSSPAGVAASPVTKKRFGCLFFSILLFIGWILGAWLLWLFVKNAPEPAINEEKFTIEIIPRSTERTQTDDNIEDDNQVSSK